MPVAALHQQEQDATALGNGAQVTEVFNRSTIDSNNRVTRSQTTLGCRATRFDVRHIDAGNTTRRIRRELRSIESRMNISAGAARCRLLTEYCGYLAGFSVANKLDAYLLSISLESDSIGLFAAVVDLLFVYPDDNVVDQQAGPLGR